MIPYSLNPLRVDVYDDLYWLRKIRDANPTSQLPLNWPDDVDPYTQWNGIVWNNNRVIELYIPGQNITTLNISGLTELEYFDCSENAITLLNIAGISSFIAFDCHSNQLASISSLTSKGNIELYDFRYNNFQTAELDRFRAMGFTDESELLPQNT